MLVPVQHPLKCHTITCTMSKIYTSVNKSTCRNLPCALPANLQAGMQAYRQQPLCVVSQADRTLCNERGVAGIRTGVVVDVNHDGPHLLCTWQIAHLLEQHLPPAHALRKPQQVPSCKNRPGLWRSALTLIQTSFEMAPAARMRYVGHRKPHSNRARAWHTALNMP